MIEIEVQNETHQTQERIRFAAVPRIGEGIRLRAPGGIWASYDVIDVWYQKVEYGDIWMPYLHIRLTPGEAAGDTGAEAEQPKMDPLEHDYAPQYRDDYDPEYGHDYEEEFQREGRFASLAGEAEPFKI
ncbi:hypothetical protein [Qipengyuania sp. ASV99]|uniref:hypothetical protein n=1 Tax=Qipengyuania sp. ASV99 TaxID=3399681 RepID=UPI003A4C80CF